MKKPLTIYDLAADLKLSTTTVWRALQNQDRVSAKTRERVLARAKAIHYVPWWRRIFRMAAPARWGSSSR
jgi:predicted transcriptional regulator